MDLSSAERNGKLNLSTTSLQLKALRAIYKPPFDTPAPAQNHSRFRSNALALYHHKAY